MAPGFKEDSHEIFLRFGIEIWEFETNFHSVN